MNIQDSNLKDFIPNTRMKRAKKDEEEGQDAGEPSTKKSFMAIPPVNMGPVSTEVRMSGLTLPLKSIACFSFL